MEVSLGFANSAAPVYGNQIPAPLSLDNAGALRVTGNFASSGGNLAANQSVNITAYNSVAVASPIRGAITVVGPITYNTVAASQSNQTLGATGATGDILDLVTIIPAVTTSAGNVVVRDNLGTGITLFVGGNLSSVIPFTIAGPGASKSGNWSVSTGANVSVVARGTFT